MATTSHIIDTGMIVSLLYLVVKGWKGEVLEYGAQHLQGSEEKEKYRLTQKSNGD